MKDRKPSDDRNIQAVMVATYHAMWTRSQDKMSLPSLSELKEDVDTFIQALSVEPHIEPEALHKRYEAKDWIIAVFDLLYYLKHGKPRPKK
jgi:hypothetical protein